MIIKKYNFKKGNDIIYTETKILLVGEIETYKRLSALKANCSIDEVEVEIDEIELSDIDISDRGMYDVNETELTYLKGIKLNIELGSDTHLDALNNGTLDKYIEFY